MRLNSKNKAIVMGNVELLRYCQKKAINLDKIKTCEIEKMGDKFVFCLNKEDLPVPLSEVLLEYDIVSQPYIVLIMWADEQGKIFFKETSDTFRVLNK